MAEVWSDPYFDQGDKVKLLVALAIADSANSDTGLAWPALETLSLKARTSVRGAQESLRALEKDGKLEIQAGKGPRGTNMYRFLPRTDCTPPAKTQITPPHPAHPAPGAPRKRAAEKAAENPPEKAAPVCTQSIRNHHYPSVPEGTTTTPESKAEEFRAAWNQLPSPPISHVRSMSEDRKTTLRARLREPFWVENWRSALAEIPKLPFLLGENERRWAIDADFFLRPGSVTKIMEGKYGKKFTGPSHIKNGLREDFSHLVEEAERE